MSGPNPDIDQAKLERATQRRLRELQAHEQEQRKRERLERAARVREEHAAAFDAPLISRELLTNAERKAIAERIRNRGRWFSLYGGLGST